MRVSTPDKVMFPAVGVTKAEVVAHYERVGPSMLEFVADRPLTLQRFPRGIAAEGFMQKNAGGHFPASIRRHVVRKRDGESTHYPVVDRVEDLAYLANQNTITFHMWTSSTVAPDRPDWMVIDLDPEADDLQGVRFAVGAVRSILDEFELGGFVLATGSKGFHVWVALDRQQHFVDVSLASRAIAGLASNRHPERLTTEFLKRNREGRVFVDWLRNTGIATVVAPFSLRARSSASVAVPVRWQELERARPDGWTLADLRDEAMVEDRRSIADVTTPQVLQVEAIVAAARAAGVDLDTPHDRFGRTRS